MTLGTEVEAGVALAGVEVEVEAGVDLAGVEEEAEVEEGVALADGRTKGRSGDVEARAVGAVSPALSLLWPAFAPK